MAPKGDVFLRDPSALRALAHRDRLAILEQLQESGAATATEIGGRIGISPSAASYHLRTLARFGLVEDTGEGRGRNRPWRAVGTGFSFEPSEHVGPAAEAAAQMLAAQLVGRGEELTLDFIAREPALPPDWRAASHIANKTLVVTAEEAADVIARIEDALRPYLRSTRGDGPDGARLATFLIRLLPRPEGDEA